MSEYMRAAVSGNSPGFLGGLLQGHAYHGAHLNSFWEIPVPAAAPENLSPARTPYEVIARDAVYWIGERSVARSCFEARGHADPTRARRAEIMACGLESRIVGRVLVQANEVLRKARLPANFPVRDILESYVDAACALSRMEAALSEVGRGSSPARANAPAGDPVRVFLREAAGVLRALAEALKLAYGEFAYDYAGSDPIGARKPVLAAFCEWSARQGAGKRTAQAISRALPRLGLVPAAAERPETRSEAMSARDLGETLEVLIELMERSAVAIAADHLRPDLSAPLSIRELAPAERVLEHTRYYVCLEFPGGRYGPFA